ncbi:MAG: transposase [Bacillota bacterium]|jgi:transposase-like protein
MPYREVDADTKVEILKQYWSEDSKVMGLAKKYGVSRESIYVWAREAERTIKDLFNKKRPGPVLDDQAKLIAENKQLKQQLQDMSYDYQRLSQNSQLKPANLRTGGEIRPGVCPTCGHDKVWRNGFFSTSQGITQRFCCAKCKAKVYLVKKTPSA